MSDIKCEMCQGKGHVFEGVDCFGYHYKQCDRCNGTGISEVKRLTAENMRLEAERVATENQRNEALNLLA